MEIYIILKVHKNFTICVTKMRDEDQTHMHPRQPLNFPNHLTVVGETPHSTRTLANFNLHQPLISFLYVIPSRNLITKYKVSIIGI